MVHCVYVEEGNSCTEGEIIWNQFNIFLSTCFSARIIMSRFFNRNRTVSDKIHAYKQKIAKMWDFPKNLPCNTRCNYSKGLILLIVCSEVLIVQYHSVYAPLFQRLKIIRLPTLEVQSLACSKQSDLKNYDVSVIYVLLVVLWLGSLIQQPFKVMAALNKGYLWLSTKIVAVSASQSHECNLGNWQSTCNYHIAASSGHTITICKLPSWIPTSKVNEEPLLFLPKSPQVSWRMEP